MKTKMLIGSLLLLIISSYSFGGYSEGVNDRVIASFKKDFSNAKQVKWESRKTFDKATFLLNEEMIAAYYNPSGELIAFSRKIELAQLPVQLSLSLHKAYPGFAIKEISEIVHDNSTFYYMVVENQHRKLVLEGSGETWKVFKIESKSEMDQLNAYLAQVF